MEEAISGIISGILAILVSVKIIIDKLETRKNVKIENERSRKIEERAEREEQDIKEMKQEICCIKNNIAVLQEGISCLTVAHTEDKEIKASISHLKNIRTFLMNEIKDRDMKHLANDVSNRFLEAMEAVFSTFEIDITNIENIQNEFRSYHTYSASRMNEIIPFKREKKFYKGRMEKYESFIQSIFEILTDIPNHYKQKLTTLCFNYMKMLLQDLIIYESNQAKKGDKCETDSN